jgi:CRP/FNR family transcriptional regulator
MDLGSHSPGPASDPGPSLRAHPFSKGSNGAVVRLLSDRQRAQLLAISTRVRVPAKTVLYREQTAAEWIFIVATGVVKSYRDLSSGRRRVFAFLSTGDVFGLAEHGMYINTTQAVTPVTLYRIRRDVLAETLRGDAELQFKFLCKVTYELHKLQRHMIVVGRRDAIGRVAMFLRQLEERPALRRDRGEFGVPMSRSDIANYLGLSLEAVSRATRALERQGIVAFSSVHTARIVSRSRFHKLAHAV